MEEKTSNYLLYTFLICLLLLKIYLVLQIPSTSYNSFYGLRYVENVKNTYMPLVMDPLSYQGRVSITDFSFFMFLSLFSFIIPTIILFKYLTILIGLAIIYLIYILVLKQIANPLIALLTAILTGLIPLIFTAYLNTISSAIVFLLLFLLLLAQFSKIEQSNNTTTFIVLFVLTTLITPLSLVFVAGFALYLILLKILSLQIKKQSLELLLFSSLFAIWYNLLLYKHALTQYGVSIFWRNIPQDLIELFYQKLTPTLAIYLIGLIPVLFGLIGMYDSIFTKRKRFLILISSFVIIFFTLLLTGMMPMYDGLLFLTICLVILAANGLDIVFNYLDTTFFYKFKSILILIFLTIMLLNFFPVILSIDALSFDSPDQDEINTMNFIKNNTPQDATILGDVFEGHFISYYSNRKNFYDDNFFLIPTANQRYEDSKIIFLSKSKIAILNQLDYYNVDYIYFSKLTHNRYSNSNFLIKQDACFEKIFETNTTEVFVAKCRK